MGEEMGPGPPSIAGPRQIVLGLVFVLVLAVGIGVLIAKTAGFQEVLDDLGNAKAAWLPVCLLLEVVSYGGYVVTLRAVASIDSGPTIRAWPATRLVMASLGATRIVSPAGAGGLALTYWALKRTGLRTRDAAARVVGLNILIFGIFGAWATIAAIILLVGFGDSAPLGMTLPWIIMVPACMMAAAWVSAPARGERLAVPPAHGWPRRALAAAVSGLLVVRHIVLQPRAHGNALMGAIIYWVGDVLCLWAALQAVGANVPIHGVALAYATAYIAMLVPLPTGGFGALDAAATFTLTLLDIPLASAFSGVVVWRAFNFWLPTVPALIELVRVRDLGRLLARGDEAQATMDPGGSPH